MSSIRTMLLVGTATIACFGVAEWGLSHYFYSRTYSYYQSSEVYWEDQHTLLLYLPDPETMWRLRPNIALSVRESIQPYGTETNAPVLYRWLITTNEFGFRTAPGDGNEGERALKIICVGDSRTLGEGLAYSETYPAQLERKLGGRATVVNWGADGWSAYQGRVLVEAEAPAYSPDIIVACFGINDTDKAWGMSDQARSDQMNSSFTSLQKRLYRSVIFYAGSRVLQKVRAKVIGKKRVDEDYGVGPPRLSIEEYSRELERLASWCRERGIQFVSLILPVNPDYPPYSDAHRTPFRSYNEVATTTPGATLTDLRDSDLIRAPHRYFIDDMHLSAEGAAYVAKHLADVVGK